VATQYAFFATLRAAFAAPDELRPRIRPAQFAECEAAGFHRRVGRREIAADLVRSRFIEAPGLSA